MTILKISRSRSMIMKLCIMIKTPLFFTKKRIKQFIILHPQNGILRDKIK